MNIENWLTIDGGPDVRYGEQDIKTKFLPDPISLPAEVLALKADLRDDASWNDLRYCVRSIHVGKVLNGKPVRLALCFGPSDYDTFRATNLSLDREIPGNGSTLRSLFLRDVNPLAPKPFLANSFGVSLLPLTRDGFLVFARRSSAVECYPGCWGPAVSEGLHRPLDCSLSGPEPDPWRAAIRGCIEELGVAALAREITFFAFGLDTAKYLYGLLGYVRLALSALELESCSPRDRFETESRVYVSARRQSVAEFLKSTDPDAWSPAGLACAVLGFRALSAAGLVKESCSKKDRRFSSSMTRGSCPSDSTC